MKKKLAGKYFFEWLGRNQVFVKLEERRKWKQWSNRAYLIAYRSD